MALKRLIQISSGINDYYQMLAHHCAVTGLIKYARKKEEKHINTNKYTLKQTYRKPFIETQKQKEKNRQQTTDRKIHRYTAKVEKSLKIEISAMKSLCTYAPCAEESYIKLMKSRKVIEYAHVVRKLQSLYL